MIIEVGQYYANDNKDDGANETCIMLIVPRRPFLPEQLYATETLAIHSNMRMWNNDWLEQYIQRQATPEEIALFISERKKYGDTLPGFGEMLTGRKLETFADTISAITDIASV